MTTTGEGDAPLERRIAALRERIDAAARRSGRTDSVALIAVSKRQSAAAIVAAHRCGVACFGENYVVEAEQKQGALPPWEICWHLIGGLQRNKAARAVAQFSLIESVDRPELAEALARHASGQGKTQRVLVEVNLSADTARAGVAPERALALCEQVAVHPGLMLEGLMGIAPQEGEPRAAFARLKELFERLPPEHRRILSMGMSSDFEVAIAEGATQVRIGTALFGERAHPTG